LQDNALVHKIILDDSFTLEHLSQFVGLWSAIQDEHIEEATEDNIS
jgi:hypothetical protein